MDSELETVSLLLCFLSTRPHFGKVTRLEEEQPRSRGGSPKDCSVVFPTVFAFNRSLQKCESQKKVKDTSSTSSENQPVAELSVKP